MVPRESARGCLPPPASITSLYIIISQWTILFVNNLLAFTIRGNNLKLRNHSRELITGPHACPLARCTSRRPRHVHVVHWAYFRLRRRRPRSRKKRSPSILFSPNTPAMTFAESINALASGFPRQSRRRRCELAGCSASFLLLWLRTDCCVFLSSNRPDRRSQPPTRRCYRSSSRVCFPIPSFLVRHTQGLSSPLECAPGISLRTLVLDFSLER